MPHPRPLWWTHNELHAFDASMGNGGAWIVLNDECLFCAAAIGFLKSAAAIGQEALRRARRAGRPACGGGGLARARSCSRGDPGAVPAGRYGIVVMIAAIDRAI